jgi:hypothetical protein
VNVGQEINKESPEEVKESKKEEEEDKQKVE